MNESTVLTEFEAIRRFEDFLSDVYGESEGGTVNICGILFDPASALKELDPIAYRCGFQDWLDAEGIQIEGEE